MAKETEEQGEVSLEVLYPGLFSSRKEIREFIRGRAFGALCDAIGEVLSPSEPVALSERFSKASREAAYFVMNDLVRLVKVAVDEDEESISIVDHPGWTFGQRINWLNTLATAAVAYAGAATRYGDLADFVGENVRGLIRHECEVLGAS